MKSHIAHVLLCLGFACVAPLKAAERPNVVWIVSEDNSIHYLKHFFPGGADAPHIEALAAEGLTFDHAFSNAPVCSVARTTLATGCYAPRIGTQFHRKYKQVPLPDGLRMFPAYLRDAGYYTTNNAKTDYNAIPSKDVWDESSRKASWRNRSDKSQPFFHMQSHAQSHESSLHFNRKTYETERTTADPADVTLADYFPDTPLFRYTHARYLDRMKVIDGIVGETVAKLKTDGVLEDTFVFYFGDHGGVLPRSKGYLYESGLHVPLVVRVPKNFRHLVDAKPDSRVDGFVSFIDFGPTVLRLAGVQPPAQVDGRAFLGKGISLSEVNLRDESFGYADRFDEKYEFARSLRKGKYQYIRNYQPWLPDGLQNNYRYKMLAYEEWRELFRQGKLTGPQKQFFEAKPPELLFDCEQDPHQVKNLAGDPKHKEVLVDLRARLHDRLISMPDLSFYPESTLLNSAFTGQQKHIEKLVTVADFALLPFEKARPRLDRAMSSPYPLMRYWAIAAACAYGKDAASLGDRVKKFIYDDSPLVQHQAAVFLGIIGRINPQKNLILLANSTTDPVFATEVLNSVVYFRDFYGDRYPVKRFDFNPRCKGADIDDRLNYLNGEPYPPKRKRRRPKSR